MVHSYNLLNQFIDISDLTPEEITNKLTFSGFEVEGGKYLASGTKLVSGHILSCEEHPDSNHLHLLKVDCGSKYGVLDIVCGAPNARKGLNVIVALEGCRLDALDVTIKKGVIRGYESNGMCCSLLELGLDKSVLSETSPSLNGIEELPEDYLPGDEDILKHLGLDDYLFDINILANRPDCLSVLGMAKELSTILDRPLKKIDLPLINNLEKKIDVRSETENCKSFSLLEINGFTENKTPLIMEIYLQAMGIRSINLIVDIGNLSMLITGQPLHMYDLSKIDSNSFVVKDDYCGKFLALDDKEYDVVKGDLVVTDGTKPMCLAGVMGGKNVECDENSSHIGIEAAHFYHASVRRTVVRTGLASDSSARFIKGVNPYLVDEAMQYTVALINKLSPNTKLVSYTKYNEVPEFNAHIDYSLDKLNNRLGSNFSEAEVEDILRRINVKKEGNVLYPPYDRLDLKEQCDIEEEVFRLNDPARIELSLKDMPQTHGELSETQAKRRKVREHLIANGFNEALTYTLVDEQKISGPNVFKAHEPYKIINPMTADHMYVRISVLPSLIEVAKYNRDRKNNDFNMFEVSSVDLKGEPNGLRLAIVMSGKKHDQGNIVNPIKDFYDIKGVVTGILDLLGIDEKRYSFVPSVNKSFHPGHSADIMIGKDLVGTIGELHPSLGYKEMVVGELDLNYVFNIKTGKTKFTAISIFPPVFRDLSFVCPPELTCKDLITAAKKAGGQLVKSVDVFDIYEKDGEKSIALNFTLSSDHTLSDAEITKTMNNIIKNVTEKLKVSLKQ